MAEINPEYERGFKDGLKSKIGEELQPMVAQVLEGISEAIKGLIPRMIDIMEIKANLDANDWIPCSERLPENLTPVIITYANRYPIMPCYQKDKDKPYVGAAYCHNDKWFWYSVTCEDLLAEYGYSFADEMDDAIEVLAWMPMPDAYEPTKEDEA